MSWIRMRTTLQMDPRVIRIASLVNDQSLRGKRGKLVHIAHVIGALHHLWSVAYECNCNGRLESMTASELDARVGIDGFSSAMLKVGWLVNHRAGFKVPKFSKYFGTGGPPVPDRSQTSPPPVVDASPTGPPPVHDRSTTGPPPVNPKIGPEGTENADSVAYRTNLRAQEREIRQTEREIKRRNKVEASDQPVKSEGGESPAPGGSEPEERPSSPSSEVRGSVALGDLLRHAMAGKIAGREAVPVMMKISRAIREIREENGKHPWPENPSDRNDLKQAVKAAIRAEAIPLLISCLEEAAGWARNGAGFRDAMKKAGLL